MYDIIGDQLLVFDNCLTSMVCEQILHPSRTIQYLHGSDCQFGKIPDAIYLSEFQASNYQASQHSNCSLQRLIGCNYCLFRLVSAWMFINHLLDVVVIVVAPLGAHTVMHHQLPIGWTFHRYRENNFPITLSASHISRWNSQFFRENRPNSPGLGYFHLYRLCINAALGHYLVKYND